MKKREGRARVSESMREGSEEGAKEKQEEKKDLQGRMREERQQNEKQ